MNELEEAMFSSFPMLTKEQQARRIMLGGNAEFILQMTADNTEDTEVGRAVASLREALQRGITIQAQS